MCMSVSKLLTPLRRPAGNVSPPLGRVQKVVNILFVADYLITLEGWDWKHKVRL